MTEPIELYCPECGSEELTQRRHECRRVTTRVTFFGGGGVVHELEGAEIESEVMDSELEDGLFCEGCGAEIASADELARDPGCAEGEHPDTDEQGNCLSCGEYTDPHGLS